MQLHKIALFMRCEVLHTRQCLRLKVSLAHLTKSSLELQPASEQESIFAMIEVCVTSFNMYFQRAQKSLESEADVNSTLKNKKNPSR